MLSFSTARMAVLLAAPALLVVLLTGCAGAAASSASAAAPVATTSVEMPKSYRFDPTVIKVPVGATVTWHNGDHVRIAIEGVGVLEHALYRKP